MGYCLDNQAHNHGQESREDKLGKITPEEISFKDTTVSAMPQKRMFCSRICGSGGNKAASALTNLAKPRHHEIVHNVPLKNTTFNHPNLSAHKAQRHWIPTLLSKCISTNLPNRLLLLFRTVLALPNASSKGFAAKIDNNICNANGLVPCF